MKQTITSSESYKKPRCKRCNAGNVIYRRKTDDFLCRRCGYIFEANNNKQSEAK